MSKLDSTPVLNHGGQAERTRLSWNRTGLALAVNAALLIHTAGGTLVRHLPAIAMLAVALGCFLFADRRYRQINNAVRAGRPVSAMTRMRILAVLTMLPTVIALVAVLV